MQTVGQVLRTEMERLGLVDGPPNPDKWRHFLSQVDGLIEDREQRIQTLEELAAYSTGELTRVRRTLARSYEDVSEIVAVLTGAVQVFRDAVRGQDAALEQSLRLARHKFSLELNATWLENEPFPEDTADLEVAASSLRSLHKGLKDLAQVIADLVEESAAAASSRKELELAGAVQKMLVPPEMIVIPGIQLHSWFQPVAHCGGDWWTAHPLTDHEGLIVMGDVTGHGAPSAIITGAVKGACDLARMGMRASLRPSQLLRMLNRVIVEAARGEYMMTGLALRLVAGGGNMIVSNAGHRAPWLVRDGQVTTLQGVREPPLGSTEANAYTDLEVPVKPGDLLVLYTDGVPETENRSGAELGEKVLRALVQDHGRQGARALLDRIRILVQDHQGELPQRDDICLVVGEIQ